MDDGAARMRSNMEKVLRAMDVIPPFHHNGTNKSHRVDPPSRASSQPQAEHECCESVQPPSAAAGGRREDHAKGKVTTIPDFDLGEKILAEQRRMTAKKRRAPGAPASESERQAHNEQTDTTPRMPLATPSSDDLVQLQRIVADIVARDIERLCAGPGRALN